MSWDTYYLNICNAVAKNSKCLSRSIGAIIVRDKSIISTGYNGPPKWVPHCGEARYLRDSNLREALNYEGPHMDLDVVDATCPRQLLGYKSGEGLEWCIASHAERNALINAARYGIATDGCRMYMDCPVPCFECLKEIINAGITEVICTKMQYYDKMAKFLVDNSELNVRAYVNNDKK